MPFLPLPRPKALLLPALTAFALLSPGQALAETASFEGYSQVLLASDKERDVGELLAMIESQNRALAQAVPYLSRQSFFAGTRLQSDYFPAMALLLSGDTLAFAPKINAGMQAQAQYKIKLRYDSMRFPDKVDKYFQDSFYAVVMVRRALDRNRSLEQQGRAYLQKLAQAQDPGFVQLLRETEGTKLQHQLRIYQLSLQVNDYFKREQYDKALTLQDEAIRLDPGNPDLYMMRGLIQSQDKHYDAAIKDLTQAIALAPDEAIFHLMRGSIYYTQGILYDRSRQDYNRSIELNPGIGMAYLLRGYNQMVLKDCPAAIADFKKACELGMSSVCDQVCKSF